MAFAQCRVYGILDTSYVPKERLLDKCKALIKGGAGIIQLRAKAESSSERANILEEIVPLFQGSTVPLIVNDDLDVAIQFPGVGLHIGQDDIPADEARDALGPDRILGLSTHSPEQATGAINQIDLLDYFAVGPVFATPTKPDYIPVGLALVKHVAQLHPSLPWFCIGGVKRQNAKQVINAGAQGLVSVSDLLCAYNTASAAVELYQCF